MPSVDSLEERWGSRWRPGKEKQFFSTRKKVIQEVVRRSWAADIPEAQVAEQMDREFDSLDKVFRHIQQRKKEEA